MIVSLKNRVVGVCLLVFVTEDVLASPSDCQGFPTPLDVSLEIVFTRKDLRWHLEPCIRTEELGLCADLVFVDGPFMALEVVAEPECLGTQGARVAEVTFAVVVVSKHVSKRQCIL